MHCSISPSTRNALRTIHSLSACGWIGGGLAVLVLLKLAGAPDGHEEAEVFQRSIIAIDKYLIVPSAGLATLSGIALCFANHLGFGGVWIKEKCLLTAMLLILGTFWVAPDLEALCPENMEAAELDPAYFRQWLKGAVAALVQTVGLLVLVAISVLKPQTYRWVRKRG